MAEEEKLKLGKGAAFVKGRLKTAPPGRRDLGGRLPGVAQADHADRDALPRDGRHGKGGSLLADSQVHGRPSVNDLATLLAHAMRRPLDGEARRPRLVRLRGHHQWRGLFPHLEEIGVGVEVSVGQGLPGIEEAYGTYLGGCGTSRGPGWSSRSAEQAKVEAMFPAIARYVGGYGYIEIGDQESFGFVVRAIGYGGLDFEDERPDTLAEAMVVLEAGLARWFDEQGVEDK